MPTNRTNLKITRSSDVQYAVRRGDGDEIDVAASLTELEEVLLADGGPDEVVSLLVEGDRGLERIFTEHGHVVTSVGWEGILVPSANRRKVRLPADFTGTVGATDVGWDALLALRPDVAWVNDSPDFSLKDSVVLFRGDTLVGWVPVWRPSPGTSIVRFVVIARGIYAGEERRLTHLRLAAYAFALESEFAHGRTVLAWMPDDDDPVNALKVSLGAPLKVTHWMNVMVGRDLRRVAEVGT